MTDPTPDHIAAALALADHIDRNMGDGFLNEWGRAQELALAYRATAPKLHDPSRISDATRRGAFQLILDGVKSDSAEWAMMRARLLDESRVPASEPNRVTDHDADQRPHPYGPSSVDNSARSLPAEPAAGATSPDACSCDESERLHGYMKDIKFLHRQWSDEKAMAGAILTQIGNVVLRWMSNLP